VVAFCGKQARSGSTDKREAACACMAELAAKIEPAAVQPHVGPMLRCLLGCFRDSSWPVSFLRGPNHTPAPSKASCRVGKMNSSQQGWLGPQQAPDACLTAAARMLVS
jgi:hypothetical protein